MRKITVCILAFAILIGFVFLLPGAVNAQNNDGSIKLTRTIEPSVITPGSTVTVTLVLDKGYMGGLSRFDEFMPHGFSATQGDIVGSHFYVSDTIVHFAWLHMPIDQEITISYHLTIPGNALGKYTLAAQFIYATGYDATATYFEPYTIDVQKIVAPMVRNVPLDKPKPVDVVSEHPLKDTIIKTTAAVANNQLTQPKANTETTAKPKDTKSEGMAKVKEASSKGESSTSSSDNDVPSGVYFRVQIMASAQRLNVDSVDINGLKDKVFIATNNGISKYFVGEFHDVKSASDYNATLKSKGLTGAFVVAYKGGKKITIKEAQAQIGN